MLEARDMMSDDGNLSSHKKTGSLTVRSAKSPMHGWGCLCVDLYIPCHTATTLRQAQGHPVMTQKIKSAWETSGLYFGDVSSPENLFKEEDCSVSKESSQNFF